MPSLMLYNFITIILKWYKPVSIVVLVGFLLGLAIVITRLNLDNSIKIWFIEGDPSYKAYLEFQENYGSDDLLTVMIEHTSSAFDISSLLQVRQVEGRLKNLAFVEKVLSLVSAVYFKPSILWVHAFPIIDSQLSTNPDIEKIEECFQKAPFEIDRFVSRDKKYSFLYIQLKPVEVIERDRDEIVRDIRSILDQQQFTYYLSGMAVLNEALNAKVIKESGLFSTLSIILITGILGLYFRRFEFTLLALLAVIIPVVYVFSFFVLSGHQLNMVTMIIPTILMVYCVADSVHIINRYQILSSCQPYKEKKELILQTLRYSWKPCFYTSLTTIAGYIGFSISPLYALKETGWFAALGIGLSFFLTFIIMGCGLMYLGTSGEKLGVPDKNIFQQKMNSFAHWMPTFIESHKYAIIIACFSIIIIAIGLIPNLVINTYPLEYLNKDDLARKDSKAIEKISGAYLPFEMLIRSKNGFSLLKPESFRAIDEFQNAIIQDSNIMAPYSITTLIKRVRKAYAGNYLTSFTIGDDDTMKRVLMGYRMFGGNDLNALTNKTFTEFRLNTRVKVLSSLGFSQLLENISHKFEETVPKYLQLELIPQGYIPLYIRMIHYLTVSQLRSFLVTFLLVILFMLFCFRNFRVVAISLIPNLVPLAAVVIVMVVFNISLDSGTVMIAAVIMGITVDDTIHFLYAFLHRQDSKSNHYERLKRTISMTGRGIMISSFALICGFGIISLSSLKSLQLFGGLCALAILIALVADLILLPVMLSLLAKDDHRPLFKCQIL